MCGLFGMMGPGVITRDLKILKEMGLASQLRGLDGSGIYQVKSATNPKWSNWESFYKDYSTFSEFMLKIENEQRRRTRGFSELLDSCQPDIFMGHVRWATRGDITQANSHPFVMNNLVGAHNGTLRDKQYEDKKKTDSEMMFADISRNGLKSVLENLHKDSAYAITMYDKDTKHMYFARNEKRDLCFAVNDDRSVIYWASEKSMLKWILDRNDQKYTTYSLHPFVIVDIYAGDMTYQNIKQNRKGLFKVTKLDMPKEKEPTLIQKAADAWRASTVTTSTVSPANDKTLALPGPVSNVVSIKKDGRVMPAVVVRDFHCSCKCGRKRLNLLEISMADRGKPGEYTKDQTTGKYLCADCNPVKQEVKEVVDG